MGTGIVLLATSRYGAGLSPDSVTYISVARNLAADRGFIHYNGNPLVAWPPLFPTLLVAARFAFGTDPLSSVHVINAILFGLIVSLSGVLLFRNLSSSSVFVLLGVVSVLVAIPLLHVSRMAWSEPLFILCVLLFLICAESYLEKGDMVSLGLLAASAATASLTRYIGVTLIVSGAIVIVLFGRKNLATKLVRVCLFAFFSSLPLGIWIIRNYVVSGALLGSRAPSNFTLSQNLNYTFYSLLSWYLPYRVIQHPLILALILVAVGFIAVLGARVNWPRVKALLSRLIPAGTFIAIYTSFLVISATSTAYDRIDNRLLSPLYVPLTLLVLVLAESSAKTLRARCSPWFVNAVISIGIASWLLVHPVLEATHNVMDWAVHGAGGYNRAAWRESETIRFLQHQPLVSEYPCYSNGPDALYILAGLEAEMSPAAARYNSPQTVTKIQNLVGLWPEEEQGYLVWFDDIHREYLFCVEELQMVANVERIFQYADGTIYRVSRKTTD